MTPADELFAGRALIVAARDADVADVANDPEPEEGIDGRDAHRAYDVFARELDLAGFVIVRKP